MTLAAPHTSFTRPANTTATEPPEAHGVPRDGVRLLVAGPGAVQHARFADLGDFLQPGDLLVINNSTTLAAAVDGSRSGAPIAVHFSTAQDDGTWVVELRPAGRATGHLPDIRGGERIELPDGAALVTLAPYPNPDLINSRLWSARIAIEGDVHAYLAGHGRPIRYAYVPAEWPLSAYQTVFAQRPGSAEMASAARPFSTELVTRLVAAGVGIAPITLHAGVSSAEPGEPPAAEWFDVPATTAQQVNLAHANRRRVIAVGTTATRALESATSPAGAVHGTSGWTSLVLGPDRGVRSVDGIITGWHDAGASHLLLLEAVAGADVVANAYEAALAAGYLWHEFGDSALLLPR